MATNNTFGVISADSHVIEPHDLWQQRVPKEFKERAPRLVRGDDTDYLVCDDAELPPVGLLAGCARGDQEVRREGRVEEDVFVGGYDPTVRLGDLERDGVDAEVLYPTIAMQMYPIRDSEFRWALFRAYNEWLAEDFCGSYPDRYFGIALINHEEVDTAVAEVERAAAMGLRGIMVPLYSGETVMLQDPQFDALWAAAIAHNMPVSLHAATTRDRSKAWNKGGPADAIMNSSQVQRVLINAMVYGLFDRFPDLKIVSAENDAGWLGALAERSDFWWRRSASMSAERDKFCKQPPSNYIRNNIRVTFMRDHTAVQSYRVYGVETLMWGNDFPHHVSTWPNSQKVLHEHFDDQPADVREAVLRGNVKATYGI